jgi:TolA-binding protein
MGLNRVVYTLFALAVFACGHAAPLPRDLHLAAAKRAESAGTLHLAADAYLQMAATTEPGRNRDYARYTAATLYLRVGKAEKAMPLFEQLANTEPPSEYTPQARFQLGKHALGTGAQARAFAHFDTLMRGFPSHGVARSAIRLRVDADEAGAQAWLARAAVTYRGTALEEPLRYQHAKRRMESAPAEAEREFMSIADAFPYPKGVHFDDALFYAAELAEARGDAAGAIDRLERLLHERETSTVMGTYVRPKYIPALQQMARWQEARLNKPESAIGTWHRLYRDLPTARERDDALANEARLWFTLKDSKSACSVLTTLVRELPDSRFVPCAEQTCALHRSDKSKAPIECHRSALIWDQSSSSSSSTSSSSP